MGISGANATGGANTNGFGFGFGPGIAYFVNQNIGLEGLVKFNETIGFGSTATRSSLSFNLGLQIYLPKAKLKAIGKDVK